MSITTGRRKQNNNHLTRCCIIPAKTEGCDAMSQRSPRLQQPTQSLTVLKHQPSISAIASAGGMLAYTTFIKPGR